MERQIVTMAAVLILVCGCATSGDPQTASFCTSSNGFELGQTGEAYPEVCPGSAEVAFFEGYERGRELRTERQEIAELERVRAAKMRERDHLEAHAHGAEAQMRAAELRGEIEQLAHTIEIKRDRLNILGSALAYHTSY